MSTTPNLKFSCNAIEKLIQQYFNINIKNLPCKISTLVGYEDWNYRLTINNAQNFIVKISSPARLLEELDLENKAMLHLEKKRLPFQLPKVILNKKKEDITIIQDSAGNTRFLRVLTWIKGRMLVEVNPHQPQLLESIGQKLGLFCMALKDFDHPAAHRIFNWDSANGHWIKEYLTIFETTEKQEIVQYFFQLYQNQSVPLFPKLRQSIIHNDANNYNIIVTRDVQNPTIAGLIDFGDIIFTHTINELAITLAYSMMSKADPLEAAIPIIKGFHQKHPLQDIELQALLGLIAIRLLISVTCSTQNAQLKPDNTYIQTSAKPAWKLLHQLSMTSPAFAYFTFRNACGFTPCPTENTFKNWAKTASFTSIIQPDLRTSNFTILDLSVGSLDLGNNNDFNSPEKLNKQVQAILDYNQTQIGIGQYGEVRPIYTTDRYLVEGNNGSIWRTIHLGIDVFMPAETPIYAPYNGVIHSFQNNAVELDYGPTIIVEHQVSTDLTFYTLYGHLSLDSLDGLYEGKPIKKGQVLCKIGAMPINGNWSPHLHFQVMLDMLGEKGNFAGVAFPHQWSVWESCCPDPNLLIGLDLKTNQNRTYTTAEILQKRHQKLGKGLSISYQKPLKMVRGFGQYLYDNTGRRYLDTVNNVAHVGHEHPKIVRAAQHQMAVLNTNTRYLHDNLVQYAEALLAKLPPELCVCHFVNSGSEANELALRMARTYSNQQDIIVIEVGYHGNTGATIDVSPYKFDSKGGNGAKAFIHKVPIPDDYRGKYKRNDPKAGEKYAAYVQTIIEELATEGKGIAGFIGESILSCGGQIEPPPNYFKTVYKYVRQAGGVCIADEVQVGFGRVGSHFWGFERQGVVPDIVTMGKPIGNGHPLAAVVTTQKVADAFANGMEYFNTFGGNPVSCAIGQAVLEVIDTEKLQANALEIGQYLREQLAVLMERFPVIGDVRGPGLFTGFELVNDRSTLEPSEAKATYLVNRAREHGILMSTDGSFHNVIKIKPPMVFNRNNVDFLIGVLTKILREDFMQP